jgi:hypothetical protein
MISCSNQPTTNTRAIELPYYKVGRKQPSRRRALRFPPFTHPSPPLVSQNSTPMSHLQHPPKQPPQHQTTRTTTHPHPHPHQPCTLHNHRLSNYLLPNNTHPSPSTPISAYTTKFLRRMDEPAASVLSFAVPFKSTSYCRTGSTRVFSSYISPDGNNGGRGIGP